MEFSGSALEQQGGRAELSSGSGPPNSVASGKSRGLCSSFLLPRKQQHRCTSRTPESPELLTAVSGY